MESGSIESDVLAQTRPALVIIDEQRRHLDPDIAYHPVTPAEEARRVLTRTSTALSAARTHQIPVVHVITYARPPYKGRLTDLENPFWNSQGEIPGSGGVRRQPSRNIDGSPYSEIMPEVTPTDDEPRVVKRRYSGFYGTDLDVVLRALRADTVVLAGVNTNNCVMATAFDAHARDLAVVVLEDACASMNGPDFHRWALRQIDAALGTTLTVAAFCEALQRRAQASHRSGRE
jgi:nicotinamidase-related amidase